MMVMMMMTMMMMNDITRGKGEIYGEKRWLRRAMLPARCTADVAKYYLAYTLTITALDQHVPAWNFAACMYRTSLGNKSDVNKDGCLMFSSTVKADRITLASETTQEWV